MVEAGREHKPTSGLRVLLLIMTVLLCLSGYYVPQSRPALTLFVV